MGAQASSQDPFVALDVDPASPERGRLIPLRSEWNPQEHLIALRPARGVTLHARRRYAFALRSALRGADGLALRPSESFLRVRDGASGGGAPIERARSLFSPALDELARAGIPRSSVVSLAVFTTEDVTEDLLAVRRVVDGAPRSRAVVDRVYPAEGATLDDLFGIASEDRPGRDVPNAPGTPGDRAVVHRTVAWVILGRILAPRVIEGSGPELGVTLRDPSGTVRSGPLEDLPFALVIPRTADLAHLPVVVVHHGFQDNRATGLVLADTAGQAGAAVLSIDAFQHGARALRTEDVRNQTRGTDTPDGISDADNNTVISRVFAVSGVAPGMEVFPGFVLGTFTQFAADALSALRFVREGELGALRALDPSLSSLSFDSSRVFYLGLSLGSAIGASVIVADEHLAGAVLNVPPGSLVETLAEAVRFRPLADAVLLPTLGTRGRFDEITRRAVFDPVVDLFRWVLEPVDPLALAPYIFRDPVVPGPRPDVLWQLGELDELAAPPATQSVLAAAGVPTDHPPSFAPVALRPLPWRANLQTPCGPT